MHLFRRNHYNNPCNLNLINYTHYAQQISGYHLESKYYSYPSFDDDYCNLDHFSNDCSILQSQRRCFQKQCRITAFVWLLFFRFLCDGSNNNLSLDNNNCIHDYSSIIHDIRILSNHLFLHQNEQKQRIRYCRGKPGKLLVIEHSYKSTDA